MKINNYILKWVDIKALSVPATKPRGGFAGAPEPRSGYAGLVLLVLLFSILIETS